MRARRGPAHEAARGDARADDAGRRRQHYLCGDRDGREGVGKAVRCRPLFAFALKLPLALAVFLLIAYAGTTDKRIAGVLFTFPILNGVAIIATPAAGRRRRRDLSAGHLQLVLFALVISFPVPLPPVAAPPRYARLFARCRDVVGHLVCGRLAPHGFARRHSGRGHLVHRRSDLRGLVHAVSSGGKTRRRPRCRRETVPRARWSRFTSFWANSTGLARIAFFVAAYACLFFAARVALNQKWSAVASALAAARLLRTRGVDG